VIAAFSAPDQHRAHRPAVVRHLGYRLITALGWRIEGQLPPAPKLVLAVGPHTSNWDFIVGVAAMLALDIHIHWLGKHSLFRWPLRSLLVWLGGIAVNRGNTTGVAEQIGQRLRAADEMILAITPEGTRRRVTELKTGFSRIARAGDCPVVPVTLDFQTRCVHLHEPFAAGDDPQVDAQRVRDIFAQASPRHPENF